MRIGGMSSPAQGAQPVSGKPGEFPAVGETLEAEVITSEDGGRLTLRAADGTVFSARTAKPLAATPGDTLLLTVTGRGDGAVFVERAAPNPAPQAVLRQLGVPASASNLRLAAALTASQLPVSTQVWEKLQKALSAFPKLTTEQAVFMLEHQVPVNRQNVTLFQRMDQQEYQLTRQLVKLEALLTETEAGSGHILPGQAVDTPRDTAMLGTASRPVQFSNSENAQNIVDQFTAKTPPVQPSGESTGKAGPSAGLPISEKTEVLPAIATQAQSAETREAQPAAMRMQPAEQPAAASAPLTRPMEQTAASAAQSQAQPTAPQPTPAAVQPVPAETAAAQGTPAAPASSDNAPPGTQPSTIQTAQSSTPNDPPPAPGSSPSPALAGLPDKVTALFRHVRSLQGEETPESLNAARLGRDIADTLREAAERAASLPPDRREAVLSLTREIAEGVRFAQQLEQFATVVQWPLMVNGEPAQAEMYVFKDGSEKKKLDPRNATLFLSLATARLGRVETLARVIGKNVECDFRLTSEESAGLVKKEADKLRALLSQRGYSLTRSSFGTQDQPSAGPITVRDAKERFGKRYNFEAKV